MCAGKKSSNFLMMRLTVLKPSSSTVEYDEIKSEYIQLLGTPHFFQANPYSKKKKVSDITIETNIQTKKETDILKPLCQ